MFGRKLQADIYVRGLDEAAAQRGTHLGQSLSLFNSTTQSLSFYSQGPCIQRSCVQFAPPNPAARCSMSQLLEVLHFGGHFFLKIKGSLHSTIRACWTWESRLYYSQDFIQILTKIHRGLHFHPTHIYQYIMPQRNKELNLIYLARCPISLASEKVIVIQSLFG